MHSENGIFFVGIRKNKCRVEMSTSRTHSRQSCLSNIERGCDGNELAEFGPTLFIVFVMLLLPAIAIGTVALRYTTFAYAAKLAASAGSKCSTFLADANPPKDCSAVTVANAVATQTVNGISGITLTKVECNIITAPLNGGSIVRQSSPLTNAADTNTNSYNFEVVLRGQVSPLVINSPGWIFNIPGISAPITTSVSADGVIENTQGLTL